MDEYVQKDGWLLGNVPLSALGSWCSQNQFWCRDADLIVGHTRTLVSIRAEFSRKLMDGFNWISLWIPRRIKSK